MIATEKEIIYVCKKAVNIGFKLGRYSALTIEEAQKKFEDLYYSEEKK